MATLSGSVPTGWWGTAGGTIADWWTTVADWLGKAGPAAGKITLIILVAIVVWIVGRLAIRGATRGLRKSIALTERRSRRLLRRAGASTYEPTLSDRLAAQRQIQRAQTVSSVLRSALAVVIVTVTVMMVLPELTINVGPLLAAAGIVGVALGFGAQSVVKDLLSGMFMLIEDQYGVGDVVDVGEASGLVELVGLRSTRLRSLDGTVWFVPNGEIRRVGNMSQLYSRAMIEVRFAFDVDIDAARQAMLDAAAMVRENKEIAESILGEPEVAGIEAMDYNSVTLRLLLQTKPITQWTVMRAIRESLRDLVLERGIPLAAPEGALLQSATTLPKPTADANDKPPAASKAGLRAAAATKPDSSGTKPGSSGTKPGSSGTKPGSSGTKKP